MEWQPSRLQEALAILASFSLIIYDRITKTVSIHRVVREYANYRLTKEDLQNFSNITASTLYFATSTNHREMGYSFREALLSHISFFVSNHNDKFASDIGLEDWAETLSSFSTTFRNRGQCEMALDLEVRAMELRSRLLGSEHPDRLRSMNRMGRRLRELKRPHEAVRLDEEVVKSRAEVFGKNYPEALVSAECLAASYIMLGRVEAGMKLMATVVNVRQQDFGEAHIGTLTTMSYTAGCYRGLGRYKEALRLEQRVFSQRR
ncbi:MAG: hypothetical protein ALECFALPRED_003976 [Alectoria fallacina]|uniref:Uncharacterized protein n=1 Tax=Alectoria fallacina TaxID=1903189 RepID=A0A8H3FLI4_9LECA|nr:MAG: hypothetical protein ALECFALPRED_003976 [Alectoria fallacina]